MPTTTRIAVSCLLMATAASAQVFNLATAARGGDGSLPGSVGYSRYWPPNGQRLFLPQASFKFVDGIFVPHDKQTTQITSTTAKFDFSQWIGGTTSTGAVTDGTPAFGPGANNDPSNKNGNPNYTGDPFRHSLMMCHANVGITFDLDAVRKEFRSGALWFTALAGASCGRTNYFVITTDTTGNSKLATMGSGMTAAKTPDKIKLLVLPNIRFLTLACGDDNTGTINCAHSFFGNPFLHCSDPDKSPVRRFGTGGKDSTGWQPRVVFDGCPIVGSSFAVGGNSGIALQAPPLVFLGFSNQTWGPIPLPLDLKPLGADGNTLYTGLESGLVVIPQVASLPSTQDAGRRVWGPFPRNGKGGRVMIALPNDSSLRGQKLYWQSIVIDPRANALGVALSDAIEATIL